MDKGKFTLNTNQGMAFRRDKEIGTTKSKRETSNISRSLVLESSYTANIIRSLALKASAWSTPEDMAASP